MAHAPSEPTAPRPADDKDFGLLLRAVQDAVQDYIIVIIDPDGRIVTWNEGARRLTGYADSEIIGGLNTCLYPPEVVADGTPARLLAQAAAEGRATDEGWRVRQDGSRFFADVVFAAMRDASGALIGFAVVSRDITDRARAHEALHLREKLLNRAQRLARIGSEIRDIKTDAREWSDECYRIFGVSPDTFVPTSDSILPLVHPDDQPTILAHRAEMAAGRCPKPYEYRVVLPDGSLRHVYRTFEFIRDDNGKPIKLLGTMHDVTEQRREEERQRQSQKMEAIGRLAGGMAHDFNNLLGIVITNLDLALEEAGNAGGARELIDEAIDGALRGAELTRQLLAFARQQPLRPVQIDLNELVRNTMSLLGALLGDDIDIAIELAQDVRPVIADPAQLEASLTHLVTNARDAMPQGGRLLIKSGNRALDADYAAEHADVTPGDFSMIEVTDTGIGIPAEHLEQVFEPFFTTKDVGKGRGLGLSTVVGFMKQSGGHVSVDSEEGVGTTLRLYLPSLPQPTPAAKPAAGLAARGTGEIVLVVEDDPALRRAVTRQLRLLGYRVQECTCPEEALDLLTREPADVLFADLVFRGELNGIDLAREAQERRPELKILLTTGFWQALVDSDGTALGGLTLLRKPYRQEELAAAIRTALFG